jgi:hypothetical protein
MPVTRYATVDDLQGLALDIMVAIPSDEEAQQRLLDTAARDVNAWLATSFEDQALYDELEQEQQAGLRDATTAEAVWRHAMGWTSWLGVVDDVASAGSVSFFRPSPVVTTRYSPAMVELLAGLNLSVRGGSMCASPSRWVWSPEEEYAAPELNGNGAS